MPHMKAIYNYLRRYFKETVDLRYLLLLTVLLSLLTAFFYSDKARLQWIGGGANDSMRLVWNFCIFGGTLIGAILLYLPFAKDKIWIRSPKFWLAVFIGAATFSFATFFYWHKEWIKTITDGPVEVFLLRISRYPANVVLLMLPAFLWWWFEDRNREPFYGLKRTNVKPYLFLLLMMVPLITAATFSADFLKQYPQAIRMLNAAKIEDNRLGYGLVFEGFYGLNFVVTEFFFRGFLLFVLSRWLGHGAVLPVAALYVTIHFGKPLGETISSFFGGIILGVIALETRSVWGGVLIHLGIAWGMELAAALAR
jgi:membrane protease YdiL (CAAX protease family)